jgi:hypothetical protein
MPIFDPVSATLNGLNPVQGWQTADKLLDGGDLSRQNMTFDA